MAAHCMKYLYTYIGIFPVKLVVGATRNVQTKSGQPFCILRRKKGRKKVDAFAAGGSHYDLILAN